MDDLLELFEEEEENLLSSPPHEPASSRSGAANHRPVAVPDETSLAASVDDRVGIRMLNRSISGIDLLTLITSSEYLYVSCAQMAASSLSVRNSTWLLQPAAIVDAATVTGKTRICTIGIVFSNTGTRVSSSQGKAFCAITLGNLSTGPAVTVLLFGPAYSKWCRSLKQGKVVLLLQPNLIPPPTTTTHNNSSTTRTAITVVINSESQLRIVGDARDFAICKAMTRGKNERGQWVNDPHQCRNFVDSRVSEYCSNHQPQKSKANKQGLAKIRNDARMGKVLTMPTNSNITSETTTQPSRSTAPVQKLSLQTRFGGSSVSSILAHLDNHATLSIPAKNKNSILNPTKQVHGLQGGNSAPVVPTRSLPSCLQNPYQQSQSMTTKSRNVPLAGAKRKLAQSNPKQRSDNIVDFLQTSKTKRSVPRGRRVTMINTDTAGFDGSVPVPKPSLLFSRNPAFQTTTTHLARSMLSKNRPEPHASTSQTLLQRQQLLAQKIQEGKVVPTAKRQHQNPISAVNRSTSMREALLFESVRDLDLETTVAARSRFASEADAEEYARSRRVVTELEQQEENKEKTSKNAKTKEASSSSIAILKEWYCQNCKRTFSNRPNSCITKNHVVKVKRQLRTEQSIDDKRLEFTNKSAEDGGLHLGSGLEWSRWKRFN
jgi:hypothetical protein